MIRSLGKTLWRAFAVEKKDIEAIVASTILSKRPIPADKHPLSSTFEELQMDDMDQVEAAVASMYVLGHFSPEPPNVKSGQELADFLHQLIEKNEEAKKETKVEEDD